MHGRKGKPWNAIRSGVSSTRPVLPTEAINPVSLNLDKAPVSEIIDMMVNEERKVATAVYREKQRIAQGIEIIIQALHQRGRLIFVGAGSSGRLGVVEATEMPPTFGTSPRLVQAIMAGGTGRFTLPKEPASPRIATRLALVASRGYKSRRGTSSSASRQAGRLRLSVVRSLVAARRGLGQFSSHAGRDPSSKRLLTSRSLRRWAQRSSPDPPA